MKIDFHTHSYYSKDGIFSPEALIKAALKRGLDGIALTDHNTGRGWKKAQKAAKKLNAVLILGEEIDVFKDGKEICEILGYFLKEEINPHTKFGVGVNPKTKTIEEIVGEIKNQGGIAIVAHPFNWRKPSLDLEKYKGLIDGIEGFNARSQTKKGNKMAFDLAKKNNFAITAGSDAHSCLEVGRAYIETEAKNLEELKDAILQKRVKIFGKESPIFVQVFATVGKIIHFFWKL